MPEYDNTNSGVLFKNNRKEKDSQPDLTGSIHVGDVEHWFSGWRKLSKNGEKFISVSIGDPKQPRNTEPAVPSSSPDEDIW